MSLTQTKLQRLYYLKKEAARRLAQNNLLAFTQYTNSNYRVNWHHAVLCDYLDRFVSGEIKRLMVFMPPRHGKSELVSRRLPAFLFGKDPDTSIIAASYSSDLASLMNRDVQRIMDSNEYGEVFQGSKLNTTNVRTVQGRALRNSDMFEIVGRKGFYKSAGVGGAITGVGASYAIIDDPIKNQQDADSETMRETVWNWYQSTLLTRLQNNRSVLVTLTRWHEDDLAGRLLKLAKDDPKADQWTVLKLPALKEIESHPLDIRKLNEPLWNSDFGEDVLSSIKASVGSRVWNSLYQQRPAALEGGMIKRHWLKLYETLPEGIEEWVQSWDLAFKGTEKSDYVVGTVWARKGADCYLIHVHRAQMDFPATCDAIRNVTRTYPNASKKLVEEAANGAAVIASLKKEIQGLIPVDPRSGGSKMARLSAASPLIEAGNVHLPKHAAWLDSYIDELMVFPNGAHDDQVDSSSQALNYFRLRHAVGRPIVRMG